MFNETYHNLKSDWRNNRSWQKFFLKFSLMGKILNNENTPTPSAFFETYLTSSWWNRYCIRSCIQDENQQKIFDAIIYAVSIIKDQGRFNHANISSLINICFYLDEIEILTHDNLDTIITHVNVIDLCKVIRYLNQARILTQDNYLLIASNPRANTWAMARILGHLHQASILTQDNYVFITSLEIPHILVYLLSYLNQAKILTQDNFILTTNHLRKDPRTLANSLNFLLQAQILTEDNFMILIKHGRTLTLSQMLSDLNRVGILTQNNFHILANIPGRYAAMLEDALYALQEAGILNQNNFNAITNPIHLPLLISRVWDIIPTDLLSQLHFERLLLASRQDNPLQTIDAVIYQIITPLNTPHTIQAFNEAQSTHTASVHRTVSESAKKLFNTYGAELNLEATINEIKIFINSLDRTLKNDAAKRCIARITSMNYHFTDRSGISTRQLLALAYIAIHDMNKRQGSLEDAKVMFIEGLYEVQRGYNINEKGIDDGLTTDKSICHAGTFNKIIEKLNGIHLDITVLMITKTNANAKFPKLAQAHAIQYLSSIASPTNSNDYQNIKELLNRIKEENSLEPIWDKIKTKISSELWEEFQEAYGNNRFDAHFSATIANGIYLPAPDLSAIESQLHTSFGYSNSIREKRLRFFENISFNSENPINNPNP